MNEQQQLRRYIDVTLRGFYNDELEARGLKLKDYIDLTAGLVNKNEELDYSNYAYFYNMIDGSPTKKTALDFGCGFGRWIKYFDKFFKRVDGCDISPYLAGLARQLCKQEGIESSIYDVAYETLDNIPDDTYDVIYSLSVFQHLPVKTLREAYFSEFLKKLKTGGYISIAMGSGAFHMSNPEKTTSAKYEDNFYDCRWTNSRCDVVGLNKRVVEKHLRKIGYSSVSIKEELCPHWEAREDNHICHQFNAFIKAWK